MKQPWTCELLLLLTIERQFTCSLASGYLQPASQHGLDRAWQLAVNLPGTRAAFRDGIVSRDKAAVIAWATALLDPGQARAAEAMALDRAGSLTPAQLRAAIRRAVMEVDPGQARKRREHAARRALVERWAEPSENAGLARRELPPAEVLAADQRVTACAKELRRAGWRAAGTRCGPAPTLTSCSAPTPGPWPAARTADRAAAPPSDPPGSRTPAAGGRLAGVIPSGFAARVTLTIPAATLLDLAGRPGRASRDRPGRIVPKPGLTAECSGVVHV